VAVVISGAASRHAKEWNGCSAEMMRLRSWLALKLLRQPPAGRSHRLSASLSIALLIPVNLGLADCSTPEAYERASDGSTVYLDQLSEGAKIEARQKIAQALSRGIGVYALGIGDEVEIFFHVRRNTTPRQYVIAPGDKLRIEFLGEAEGETLQVRPDGRISLALIGPVLAAGQTASALAAQLQRRYSGLLTEPKITVNVTESHTPLDDFLNVLGASTKGRSIVDKVLPDGTIALPLLPSLKARGRTLRDLEHEIDAVYAAKGLDVFVSLVPRSLRSNATLVIGEVGRPGRIELDRPATVAMAVARAGGLTLAGSSVVRLFYIGGEGVPRVRSINLKEVMDDFKLEEDMIVPANSIIYVPPTELAQAGRLMDAIMRDILRFQGFAIGSGFMIE
jgi:protein involved in polysaccharide export with SLBB domain